MNIVMVNSPYDNVDLWSKSSRTYFWDPRSPFETKFQIEKMTGILLKREPNPESNLTYSGTSNPPTLGYNLKLVFQSALPKRNWYSFEIEAWVPRSWYSETEFQSKADRAFDYWTRNLPSSPNPKSVEEGSGDLYFQRTQEAVEKEKQESIMKPEDVAEIQVIQKSILNGLRKGKSFRTAHHEGGTRLFFDGANCVRRDYGEEESTKKFQTEKEFLDCIREFYDWESRRGTYPHRPPELETWKFIQQELKQY